MPTLETKDGVLRFCADQREAMESSWRRRGRFEANGYSYCAFVFATHLPARGDDPARPESWRPGKKLERVRAMLCQLPPVVHLMRPDHRNTDIFAYVLRHYARACAAAGVLTMGEAWFKTYQGPNGERLSQEEVQRLRDADPACLGDAPGRGEMLWQSLEHPLTGKLFWRCEVRREPSRLMPWSAPACDADGLLVDILPPQHAAQEVG